MKALPGIFLGADKITGSDGRVDLDQMEGSSLLSFQPSWDLTSDNVGQQMAEDAIDVQDAISILKMVVGLPINSDNSDPSYYQALAADYDADGSVGVSDAIDVLKHVVGLPATGQPKWDFVHANADFPTGGGHLHPGVLGDMISADTASATEVGLIGVLRGDVDGSWELL